MGKKKDKKKKEKDIQPVSITSNLDDNSPEVRPKTAKKYIIRAEKIVKKLDKVLGDIADIGEDVITLRDDVITSEADEKDIARFTEMAQVVKASGDIMYHLVNRMSRKYLGKETKSVKKAA